MKLIPAKHILSTWSNGDNWFGTNYNMNIYKGCNHGCIYCDSRSECYQVENFDEVRGKENTLNILENELISKRKKGIIGTGAMSDPYNPYEKNYELTRGALKLINKYQYGIGLLTKSDLVVRDIDILKQIKKHSPTMVNFTITTYNDELGQKIEPHVALSSQRFKALKKMSASGIYTGVLLWPILPFINDTEDNIRKLVNEAAFNGAHFVIPYFGVTLRENQRDYFYQQLDGLFPGLKERYIKSYGIKYQCISPNEKKLWNVFLEACNYYKLPYRMSDIILGLKQSNGLRQLSLF